MEQYCSQCGKTTKHKEMVQHKKSKYEKTVWGGLKEFIIERFLIPECTDYTLKAICDLDRYVVCEVCGKKTLDNKGEELE